MCKSAGVNLEIEVELPLWSDSGDYCAGWGGWDLIRSGFAGRGGRRAAGDVSSDWRCHSLHSLHSLHTLPPAFPFPFLPVYMRSSSVAVTAALLGSTGDSGDALTPQTLLRLHPVSLMGIFRPTFLLHVADIKTHCCVFSHTLSVDYMRDFCLGWKMIVCVVHGNTLLTYDYDKTNGFWPQLLILII